MAGITLFDFEDCIIRSVMIDGAWWFVAVDVCRVIEHSSPHKAILVLDPHQVQTIDLNRFRADEAVYAGAGNTRTLTPGIPANTPTLSRGIQAPRRGNPNLSVVSEGGLYKLVMRSNLAVKVGTVQHRFANWVVDDLLPALRKYGTYSLTDNQQLREKRAYYEGLPERAKSRALLRQEAVERMNALIAGGEKVGAALKEVAAEHGCSTATVRRWRNETYMVADPDIPAALAPKWYGERGMQVECDPDALRRYLELCARGLRFAAAYQRVLDEAGPNGWGPIPCAKTMRRAAGRALPQREQHKKIS